MSFFFFLRRMAGFMDVMDVSYDDNDDTVSCHE